jgi:hypothetical protein
LDGNGECVGRSARVDAHHSLREQQMAGRTDGQILGETFDETEDEGLEIIHGGMVARAAGTGGSNGRVAGFVRADADGFLDR